jgi:proteasome lid subunit RPN8/RPN11
MSHPDEPRTKKMPRLTGPGAARRLGSIPPGAPPVFFHTAALEAILDFSLAEPDRECGGFLLGGWYRDRMAYVEVQEFLAAAGSVSAFSSLTFTHASWAMLHRHLESRRPPTILLGWHHTHPGLGISFSRHDRFIQDHFFCRPWQVATVVDPRQRELGLFQWVDGRIENTGVLVVPAARTGRGE